MTFVLRHSQPSQPGDHAADSPGPAGAGVVCLHASSSSSRQWRSLAERLGGRFQIHAPDLYGCGDSPLWSSESPLTFADELARLEPVFRAAGESFDLVGHSYGGAVALHAALTNPDRVRSLVLYEPVLFGLLIADDARQPAAGEIVAVRDDTVAAAHRGDLDASAERFIDYWMGVGSWAGIPGRRRASTAASMRGVSSQWDAIFGDQTPLSAYTSCRVPTLLLTGAQSPASSRAVAKLLARTLPSLTTVELDGVGHMAPVTHPDLVNAEIEAHLARQGYTAKERLG